MHYAQSLPQYVTVQNLEADCQQPHQSHRKQQQQHQFSYQATAMPDRSRSRSRSHSRSRSRSPNRGGSGVAPQDDRHRDDHHGDETANGETGEEVKLYIGNLDYGAYDMSIRWDKRNLFCWESFLGLVDCIYIAVIGCISQGVNFSKKIIHVHSPVYPYSHR